MTNNAGSVHSGGNGGGWVMVTGALTYYRIPPIGNRHSNAAADPDSDIPG